MRFVKMHGCGNAYVYIDARTVRVHDPAKLAVAVADADTGIGSDGLILVEASERADARMAMFNADGSRGAMCGNGIRCLGRLVLEGDARIGRTTFGPMSGDKFANVLRAASEADPAVAALLDLADTGQLEKSNCVAVRTLDVETDAGIKRLTALDCDGAVEVLSVDIGPVRFMDLQDGGLAFVEDAREIDAEIGGATHRMIVASTGNLHAILFVPDTEKVALASDGPRICNASIFPSGANVHFVQVTGQAALNIRHWERGSGATLACGTGASASVAAAFATGKSAAKCRVSQPGGDVVVQVTAKTTLLTGPAEYVCRGDWHDGHATYD